MHARQLDHVFDYKVHKTVDEVNKFTAGKFADVVIDNGQSRCMCVRALLIVFRAVGGYVDVGSDTMPALHKGGRYFSLLARKVDALVRDVCVCLRVFGYISNMSRTTGRTKGC